MPQEHQFRVNLFVQVDIRVGSLNYRFKQVQICAEPLQVSVVLFCKKTKLRLDRFDLRALLFISLLDSDVRFTGLGFQSFFFDRLFLLEPEEFSVPH